MPTGSSTAPGERVAVEGDSWFAAFTKVYRVTSGKVAGVSCTTRADGAVDIRDMGSELVYSLRSAAERPADVPLFDPGQLSTRASEPAREMVAESAPEPSVAVAPEPVPVVAPVAEAPTMAEAQEPVVQRKVSLAPVGRALLEEGIVDAFERLQDMYLMKNHDQVAAFALRVARQVVPCSAGFAFLTSPGKYELYLSAADGTPHPGQNGTLSMRQGIVGFSVSKNLPVKLDNPVADPRYSADVDVLPPVDVWSLLCVPLSHEGKTVGALELFNREGGSFEAHDAHVVSYIAGATAEYLDTALPSREADFRDHEFDSVIPPGRPARGPAPSGGRGRKPGSRSGSRS